MSGQEQEAARQRVDAYITSLEATVHAPAPEQWVIALQCADLPLQIELRIRGPLLHAEAAVVPPAVIDPHQLLFWNRQAPFVCFAENALGEVFITGEMALEQLSAEMLDRFLGLLLASATRAREFAITNP